MDLSARAALMGNPQPDEEDEEDNLDTYDNEEDGDDDDGEGDVSGDIAVPSNGGSRQRGTAGTGTRGRKPRGSGASINARNTGASGQDPPRKNKKGGGRPKDFIWAFFTGELAGLVVSGDQNSRLAPLTDALLDAQKPRKPTASAQLRAAHATGGASSQRPSACAPTSCPAGLSRATSGSV